jgi:hypothetical protein
MVNRLQPLFEAIPKHLTLRTVFRLRPRPLQFLIASSFAKSAMLIFRCQSVGVSGFILQKPYLLETCSLGSSAHLEMISFHQ